MWSNHLLATACAAAKFGLKATAFVRGEDVNTDSLFLSKMFGMKLIFTDRQMYRNKHALFDSYFGDDPEAFFVDEGGAGELAVRGCSELIAELKEHYHHIFCAAGTGTTAAGILRGLAESQLACRLHVLPVLKGAAFLREEVQLLSKAGLPFAFHDQYHFGGYARTSPALLNFISEFASTTGVLLDQVYTGKMMFSIFDLARQDYFEKGQRILAVHSGGLFGLLGLKTSSRQ
ncbi:1-aminocyclopropane-1-carboxylate deaminase/D-cysteine desulfhydrase [Arcticibacter sp. MXS-1]|uniref:1-aminocyclopropane-1-carboxylate deaminase/D-cysteine desulfhydrase n=1 Tax=Arcticibacter sp. MXS-1 TaxID=3341726 RepID=UPI0035A8BE28